MVGKKILRENPVLVYLAGLCPAVAVTTSVLNSLALGLGTLAVLMLSSGANYFVRNLVPSKMATGFHIIVCAGLTTMVQLILDAYLPETAASLGIFVGLIAVNCIVIENLGFSRIHSLGETLRNGLGLGLGFLFVLILMGSIREIAGQGTFFGIALFENNPATNSLMLLVPGGLMVLSILCAITRWLTLKAGKARKGGVSA